MTVMLVIAGAWLGLGFLVLFLVLGMVHAADTMPTPRPFSPTPLALDGYIQMTAVDPKPFDGAPRRAARLPSDAV